jgi:hypothetical protein
MVLSASLFALACSNSGGDKAPAKTAEKASAKKAPAKTPAKTATKAPTSQPAAAPGSQPASAPTKQAEAPKARVYFIWPDEGSKVPENFDVVFGLEGMEVSPAGTKLDDATQGHHHLILDGKAIPYGSAVPADAQHLHFGKGQVQTTVKMTPGKHTLTMQFADGAHRSFGPALSTTINVEVVAQSGPSSVKFLSPTDGAKVPTTFAIKMGIEGMAVRPAGEDAKEKTSGHHHILVDGNPLPIGAMVPKTEKHIHYGKGQTETELSLSPGQHTLTLQLADGAHRSYGPSLSHTINITVE